MHFQDFVRRSFEPPTKQARRITMKDVEVQQMLSYLSSIDSRLRRLVEIEENKIEEKLRVLEELAKGRH